MIGYRFNGHQTRVVPRRELLETIFNKPGGHPEYAAGGSAYDYSREVSYHKMEITSHIVDWIDLPQTEKYYAGGGDGGRQR